MASAVVNQRQRNKQLAQGNKSEKNFETKNADVDLRQTNKNTDSELIGKSTTGDGNATNLTSEIK